jgi:hypothetical protein
VGAGEDRPDVAYGTHGWVLPELTLGWDMLAWCGKWLRAKPGGPWRFTAEQARFLLWFYALSLTGRSCITQPCCSG